eukprot:sb/3466743/
MVTTCPSLLEQHAGPLADRLGVLLQDTEENVRSSALALGKQFLSETSSTKLEPFLNILCVQLSSGLLHIDKGVQRTTLSFLIHLLDHHLASTLAHFSPLMGALCTLLKTSKNKPTILLLCQVVFRLLSATITSGDKEGTAVCKAPGVALWKIAGVRKRESGPTANTSIAGDIVPLVRSVVPHLETIWLEDAPPQIYATAEPSALRTATFVAALLHRMLQSGVIQGHLVLSLTKYLAARYPFSCSVPRRDAQSILVSLSRGLSSFCYYLSLTLSLSFPSLSISLYLSISLSFVLKIRMQQQHNPPSAAQETQYTVVRGSHSGRAEQ